MKISVVTAISYVILCLSFDRRMIDHESRTSFIFPKNPIETILERIAQTFAKIIVQKRVDERIDGIVYEY